MKVCRDHPVRIKPYLLRRVIGIYGLRLGVGRGLGFQVLGLRVGA